MEGTSCEDYNMETLGKKREKYNPAYSGQDVCNKKDWKGKSDASHAFLSSAKSAISAMHSLQKTLWRNGSFNSSSSSSASAGMF